MKSSLEIHRHLKSEDMNGLLEQSLPRATAFLKIAHLHLCQQCRATLEERFGKEGAQLLSRFLPGQPQWKEGSAQAAAEFAAWHSYFREEDEANALFVKLRSSLEPEKLLDTPDFRKLGLATYLLARSRKEWYQGTHEGTKWARLALAVLRRVDPGDYPRSLVQDKTALAWIFLGQGLRVERRFAEAWQALRNARYREPSGEEAAWYFTVRACLRRDGRQFTQAKEDFQQAFTLFKENGLSNEALEVQAAFGVTLVESCQMEMAVRYLRKTIAAWKKQDTKPEPVVQRTILHNLAYALTLVGRAFEAAIVQREIQERFVGFDSGKPYVHRRARWLDALIAQGLGQGAKARRIFRELRDEFLEAGVPYDAALVALDLAVVCLNEGRTGEAARLALESGPIFEAHGTSREGWMAFCILIQSLKAETATVAQVHEVIDQLRAHQAADLPET